MVTEVFMFLTQDKLVVSTYEIITHVFEPVGLLIFFHSFVLDYSLFIPNYITTNILHAFHLCGSTIQFVDKSRRCNL